MSEDTTPFSMDELLRRIEKEYATLEELVSRLTPDELTRRAAGRWSVKDNLAHLTAWERFMQGHYLGTLPAHEAMQLDESAMEDASEDEINAQIWERDRDRPLDEVIRNWRATHAETLQILQATPFERLMEQMRPDDAEKRPRLNWIVGNTSAHYEEHRQNVERELAGA